MRRLLLALLGPAAASASEFPTASEWRVVNAEPVIDHWKIGELIFTDAEGQSTEALITNVIYSHHYDANNPQEPGHDLNVLHDDLWVTDSPAAEATYGHIKWWDTGDVTSMRLLVTNDSPTATGGWWWADMAGIALCLPPHRTARVCAALLLAGIRQPFLKPYKEV